MRTFIITLHMLTIFNHFLMALILWLRKNNTRANKILGVIIILPTFPFISNLLVYLDKITPVYIFIYISLSIGLLFGPCLLYYFNLMLGRTLQFNRKQLLHFIPSLLAVIVSLSQLFLSHEQKMALIAGIKGGTDDIANILSFFLLLHILSYLFLSWRMQKKHFKELTSFYTDLEHTRYLWVKKFIRWLIILNILFIIAYSIPPIFAPHLMPYADLVAAPSLTFLIYLFIMITGFTNHAVFTDTEYKKYTEELIPFNEYVKETNDQKKYGSATLKEDVIETIREKLLQVLKEHKPYLDKELSLNKLAGSIGINSNQLSQFINRTYHQNFYDFINSYRVEEAKVLLINPDTQNLKIEAIGESAGFNSRATFFYVFKKFTGVTPLVFKKNKLSK